MGSQIIHSWILTSGLLAVTTLLLPALSQDTLLCYFCPLQHKTDSCVNTTSRCPPTQRCSSSRGHYGLVHVLSAQGCMDVALCGSYEILSFKGTDFNVSHTCCCKDKCNTPPKTGPNMELLLGMITEKEYSDIRNVLQEEFWDSCANYI
ncbi:hypothetical protein D4764_13G0005820 [Takifugu flavidus]|uniref:UPAR/Ly6 domain-containing protein n=1 Tax=Takifugu flavidus TaxID=433684 RepID=A0A5C6PCE1_9TELE|nr:hypothetical protein D4764_13G0005820 [Takifugu flavidus]